MCMNAPSPQHYDVIISGGGLAGLSLALKLAQSGVHVALVEARPLSDLTSLQYDGRTTAIAADGRAFYTGMGVWDAMLQPFDAATKIQPAAITDIHIQDGNAPSILHFDCKVTGGEPMGHILENRTLRRALLAALQQCPSAQIISPASIITHQADANHITVTLESGTTLSAQLLVVAEGKKSPSRQRASIAVRHYDYHQHAMVCIVQHTQEHHGIALEKFLPAGPFAALPLAENGTGKGTYSAIVWTESADRAPLYLAMPEDEFAWHLAQRYTTVGDITLASMRAAYPLSLSFAEHYTAPRLCLMGDACHAIHPIAGQGFNLSLRDVQHIARAVITARQLGLDVGTETVLATYTQLRTLDNQQMIRMTDGLNRLFSNHHPVLRAARRFGLQTVQALPPLKKFFMQRAMGTKMGTK